jgi:hypothetical protein
MDRFASPQIGFRFPSGAIDPGDLGVRCVSLSTDGNGARKRALRTIFDELGAKTFRERRAVVRELYHQLSVFVRISRSERPPTARN